MNLCIILPAILFLLFYLKIFCIVFKFEWCIMFVHIYSSKVSREECIKIQLAFCDSNSIIKEIVDKIL
uniref:Putative secreted protein n=1 Tax=Anopheles darlingi TaxID=43151 RepID=A0A2M4D4C1_ANODA